MPGSVPHLHGQGIYPRSLAGQEPLGQRVLAEIVHHKADRPEIHAVDRLFGAHDLVQGLQH